MTRILTLLALLVTVVAVPGIAEGGGASSLSLTVDWTMPDRLGLDANGDGRLDLPLSRAHVHNRVSDCPEACPDPRFEVHLTAAVEDAAGATVPAATYSWSITGGDLERPLRMTRTASELSLALVEGTYEADVRARVAIAGGWVTVRRVMPFQVDDILVVVLGDSYASGEGNPDIPRRDGQSASWADGLSPASDADHARAHRSGAAWPVRTALAMERADPRTSVTFVGLAASGHRIDAGILAPREAGVPGQLAEAKRLVGDRQVDLVLVQAGGNSIGFSHLVRALVDADPQMDPICYRLMLDQTMQSVTDGDWTRRVRVSFSLPFRWSCVAASPGSGPRLPGLDGLPGVFDRLAAGLEALAPRKVALVGYPDPTGLLGGGEACREIVGDTTSPFAFHEISRSEGTLGVDEVLLPLNRAMEAAAARHGWIFVGEVAARFADGHGYCGDRPDYGGSDVGSWYRSPAIHGEALLLGDASTVSWYRTARQSSRLQGPSLAHQTEGTLHPNELGHAAIARLVLGSLSGD